MNVTYQSASRVAVISPGMRRVLVRRGVPEDKVSVVFNWVDETVIVPREPSGRLRRALALSGQGFVILFAGNHGEAQGLSAWVDAMTHLGPDSRTHLVLMGNGTQKPMLQDRVRRLGLQETVHFLPSVPVTEVSDYTADADVSVVSLKDDPLFRVTMPGKTQAVLAQGKPVVCSVPGDAAEIIRAAGAGWTAQPDDPNSIAQAIRQAMQASPQERGLRGDAGRQYYMDHMSREVGSGRPADILRNAMDDRRRAGRPR